MKNKTKPLDRLTAAQKRVEIAKDAIKQIKAEKFLIQQGTWCEADSEANPDYGINQACLTGQPMPVPSCRCCALGAALLSSVRLFNVANIYGFSAEFGELHQQLRRFFSNEQLSLIEGAFEQREEPMPEFEVAVSEHKSSRMEKFGSAFEEDDERAIAIFKNIIKNNGTFVP